MTKLAGTVRVVGAGLLGTSLGLALSKQGIDVVIASQSQKSVDLAVGYGAGRLPQDSDNPQLIVVCVPPSITAAVVDQELRAFPEAVVTDVASVKGRIIHDLRALNAPIERYVGSHPMAGRERGGAIAGRSDLFVGRPWVITANESVPDSAVELVADLAARVDAAVIKISSDDHDRAVALVSHVPQVISSLLAARLVGAEEADVALAGQGLRDTTRIAASDPALWVQIFQANLPAVLPVLKSFQQDLSSLISDIESGESSRAFESVMQAGNAGVNRIPGKHGGKHTNYSQVVVMVADKPGEIGRLLTEVGQIGVNLEEFQLEHSPSAPIGLAEIFVLPEVAEYLTEKLIERGWRIA